MTSVVDTSVKFFHSEMVNAPVLTGVAGSGIALLDAVLKDGFDLKTPTSLVVAGGVATLSFSGTHSALKDSVILVAGSSIGALNGEQKVTAIGAGFVKFATAAADGTASGSITFKMAPLGWSKAFTGTNLAAYKSLSPESPGFFIRIDDSAGRDMRVVGYESMSTIDVGVAPFPTAEQYSGGLYWAKSWLANTNPVRWVVAGDAKTFYFMPSPYTGNGAGLWRHAIVACHGFGDMIPLRPGGDAFACAISGVRDSNWLAVGPQYTGFAIYGGGPVYTPRNYHGLGGSFAMTNAPYIGLSGDYSGITGRLGDFPSPIDGGLRLSRRFLNTADRFEPRCDIPGLLHVPHGMVYEAVKHTDVIAGGGEMAGRNLMGVAAGNPYSADPNNLNNVGVFMVDITGPWR